MSTISQHTLVTTHTITVEVIHLATGHSAQVTATSLEAALMHAIKLATVSEHQTRTYRGLYARII